MGLWGKTKEEEQAVQEAAQAQTIPQPQVQVPQPPPTQSVPPPPIPDGAELPEELEEVIDGADDGLKRIFMEFNSALSAFEDDDLGIIFGRLLQEMIDRQLEVSDTTGSLVRRLRRTEAILAHLIIGGKHKLSITNGRFECECGGLSITLSVPQDDKFVWDNRQTRPKEHVAEEEYDEDAEGGDQEGGE